MNREKERKQQLNIAMLGHKRVPSREGGIEQVVGELSIRMAQKGHSVTCFNRSGHHVSGIEYDDEKWNTSYQNTEQITIKKVFTINRKGIAALTSSFFGAIQCAFGKYDIVHFHGEGPSAMLWIPKLFGKKCIVTIHGLDWKRAKWKGFSSLYIKMGEKIAVLFADRIIVLSNNNKQYFKDTYGRAATYIPNGVNRVTKKSADIIKKYGVNTDEYILYLGRLVPEKGAVYLIEAFKRLKTDKKLIIAGGSSDTREFVESLKEMAAEDDRIIFTGFVQGSELEELYSNAYVYCLPSDLEGMPLALLEAMSYGNCCITSDIEECSEVLENKGIIFRRGDIEHLRETLQKLCDEPDLVEHYKREAAEYICKKYNWDEVTDQTLDLYRQCMR